MEIFANAVASIIIGIVAAIISSNLTLGRFRKQRLWEKKFIAYDEILDALFQIETQSTRTANQELHDIQYNEEYMIKLKEDAKVAFRFLHKKAAIGKIVISPDAAAALEQFFVDTADALKNKGYTGETMLFTSRKASECITAIEAAAKHDLEIKS